MALRPEEKSLAWPARAFLPAGGHLMRRIQMLKGNVQVTDRCLSTSVRIVTTMLLLLVGTVVVAYRGPAAARGVETPPAAGSTKEPNRLPFELSFISPSAMGVWAVRPAAIARIPGLKSAVESMNNQIGKAIGLPRLEAIDQAVVEFKLLARDQSKKIPGRIATGDWMVRTVKDFDWKTPIEKLVKADKKAGKLIEVRYEDLSYYKVVGSAMLGPNACFYIPDGRTAVCSFNEDHLRKQIQRRSSERPEFLNGESWQRVEKGLFVGAIDNRKHLLKLDLQSYDPPDMALAVLVQEASGWVGSLDFEDALKFRAIATCDGDAQGEALAQLTEDRIKTAREIGDGAAPGGRAEKVDEDDALVRTGKLLLGRCRVHREGSLVDVSSEAKVGAELLAAFVLELTP
jgi:hypothetical protein